MQKTRFGGGEPAQNSELAVQNSELGVQNSELEVQNSELEAQTPLETGLRILLPSSEFSFPSSEFYPQVHHQNPVMNHCQNFPEPSPLCCGFKLK